MNQIISELGEISERSQSVFGELSTEQLSWKTSSESWSIGQCFEHLIKSNEPYYKDFDEIAKGTRRNSFYEKYSPLSRFFGKLIASALKKDNQKTKTISQAVPLSDIDPQIIEKFTAHQANLIKKIEALKNADWRKTKLTSPFLKIATYNLTDTFQIIIEHEKRHFRQAERVLHAADFPR
jgi:recombinational DNA repair protein RecT